ncbi:MAG TPA: glycerol-3-phosphate 1-O-acyltransferase PlsB [Steroidobacteraceae bacterium]|jgi:glycerol-3-phosphate O-acyltransferase|nr:glycerol-3-phosphate 1-O-acyltransferase PlsB [Steroidobacteraceae bacterium]
MGPLEGLSRAWHWSVRKALSLWVRSSIKPDEAAAAIAARPRPVCYVLERESKTDLAVLCNVCSELNLPRPDRRLPIGEQHAEKAYFELIRPAAVLRRRRVARAPRILTQLIDAAAANPQFDVDLVPVAIFWGRAPHKEASLWRLLLAEDWVLAGRFRKALNVLVNGRNTLVHFGEPVRLRDAMQAGMNEQRSVRRLLRILRSILRAQRASTIGPDLSHRRTLVAQLLKTADVRNAVRREMRARGSSRRAALITARRYAVEIAANYSQVFVRFMAAVLGWLWNRVFDGVQFEHAEQLNEAGDGAEVIYVPCHRSHMDYLLLSYVIYRKGFAVPHVAAGINLNLPLIGRYLRKGGAFFLRRSFKGDALYAVVFARYLGVMMARGHSLEYFIEGGRSRTGRLLPPRTGMLSMTVRAYLRHPKRRVVFMPVYFGYERIVEGRTYIGELSGQPKKKESVLGLIRSTISVLRSKLGKVHVNMGRPISLDALLSRHNPEWRSAAGEDLASGASWIGDAVNELAIRINIEINAAAAVTPINLVATALLATPRQALAEADLVRQLELYQKLLRAAPYSPLVTVARDSGAEMIRYTEAMGVLERQKHPLGDVMRMDAQNAVLATYYRNNILHLFAMPSLLACCFVSNASMHTADIHRLVWRVYPYISMELYLRWDETAAAAVTDSLLDTFAALNLLQPNADWTEWRRPPSTSLEGFQLSVLAQAMIQTLERYYLAIALLLQSGSGTITQEALEERCHLTAQRISLLYELNSPEFFDKSLFRNFIDLLLRRGVIQESEDRTLLFGEPLLGVAADAQLVLSEQIRRSILQVTLGQPQSQP